MIPFEQTVYARTYLQLGGNKYYIFYDSKAEEKNFLPSLLVIFQNAFLPGKA